MTRDSLNIIGPSVIGLLYLIVGISQIDMISLFSAKILFPCCFNTRFPGIISPPVLLRVFVQKSLVDFGDGSEKVVSGIHWIVSNRSGLALESRKHVFYFIESHVGLDRDLLEHHNRLEADLSLVGAVFGHLFPYRLYRDLQNMGQGNSIERLDLAGGHQDIIGDFVSDENLSIAVVYRTSCRIDNLIEIGSFNRPFER